MAYEDRECATVPILASSSVVKDADGLQAFKAMNDAKRAESEAKGRAYRAGFIAADTASRESSSPPLPSKEQQDSAQTAAVVEKVTVDGQQQAELIVIRSTL